MMKIDNNTNVVPSYPQNVQVEPQPKQTQAPPPEAAPTLPTDRAEVSPAALSALESSMAIRANVVSRVKTEISAGTYLTPERISGAVDRLAEKLNS